EDHNGGAVHFGGDGKLYVAVGNNSNNANSQSLSTRLGKMLRMNTDGSAPADNPFAGQTTGVNRVIWAQGLRNPFTFAVQPGTGKIFINDVGQASWEEIDPGIAGANYGWPDSEGNSNLQPNETGPIYAYPHSLGCAITGGTFYNPPSPQLPTAWVGHYFFADYCNGWIKRLDPATNTVSDVLSGGTNIVDLKTGPDGALYYANSGTGAVRRIRSASGGQAPAITVQPAGKKAGIGQTVKFTVAATGSATLAYQWQRNGADIGGATNPELTLTSVAASDSGAQFRVVVSNASGSVVSNSATLTVPGNAPVATITAPPGGSSYNAGQTITYSGSATDTEDGPLPASAFSWTVLLYHADTPQTQHTHPVLGPVDGATSGSFVVPNSGETSVHVWYRILLKVTDSSGVTSTDADPAHDTFVDIVPRIAALTFQTSPAGLQVTLDGSPLTTPVTVSSVVGMIRTVGAPPQSAGGTSYGQATWSDGGAATHSITTPANATTYQATYTATVGGLSGEYYDNVDLTNLRLTRTDPTVNFDWAMGSPDPAIAPSTFSVRWTGMVTPRFSQTYTFYARTNDGVRLWIGGQKIIDQWVNQAATETSGVAALTAGQPASVKMEYYQDTVNAVAQLSWASASQAKEIIPQSQLTPAGSGGGGGGGTGSGGGGGGTGGSAADAGAGGADGGAAATFPLKINFQLASAPVPAGYLPDGCQLFGARAGGLSYGWNFDHTDYARDRNINADQRLDTICQFHTGGVWEVAVPNGTYNVLVSIGDPAWPSTYTLNVEGVNYWNAVLVNANHFASMSRTVTVSDGRLTLDQGSAADLATRIDYVEITIP
ncbi:MAG TPA: PQQ-dependent sugar dehydrogenase, partial [Polyangia bacterium]|nr:PQQ-dependent sugar dehydrogenase [Polyangia bacterium]